MSAVIITLVKGNSHLIHYQAWGWKAKSGVAGLGPQLFSSRSFASVPLHSPAPPAPAGGLWYLVGLSHGAQPCLLAPKEEQLGTPSWEAYLEDPPSYPQAGFCSRIAFDFPWTTWEN